MAHIYPLTPAHKAVFAYNLSSLILWFCCFCRFLVLLPLVGRRFLPGGIADFFHGVSALPLFEIILVKILINPTYKSYDLWGVLNGIRMVWVCYGVIFTHPKVAKHTSYSFIIASWCITYIIHYAYYSFRIKTRSSPFWLFWLNYNHYWITFPVSMVSEMIITFLSLGFVQEKLWLEFAIQASLLSYIPVAYFQWGYIRSIRYQRYQDLKVKMLNSSKRQPDQTSIAHQSSLAVEETRQGSPSPIQEDIELRNISSVSSSTIQ